MSSAQDLITQLLCFSGSGSQPVLCPKHGFEQVNSSDRPGIVAASIISTVRCKWYFSLFVTVVPQKGNIHGDGTVYFSLTPQVWLVRTVCSSGRGSSSPCPQGVAGLGGDIIADVSCPWGWGQGNCLTDSSGPVTSPSLFLTPPYPDICQLAPGQCGDPAHLLSRHVLSRQGAAAPQAAVHQHESFSPPPPAKYVRCTGINENLVGEQILIST